MWIFIGQVTVATRRRRRLTLDLISITDVSTLAVEGGFILFLDILQYSLAISLEVLADLL